MDDGKYDDLIWHRVEIDRIREAPYEGAACLTLHARVRKRFLEDAGQGHVDLRSKGAAKPRTLVFVPVTGVQ
jgi:hypothetical protein